MHLAHLHLENVRGVGEGDQALDLDLRGPDGSLAGWTVFAGPNGSGKTTLLQAIAFGLNQYISLDAANVSIESWVHGGSSEGRLACSVAFDPEDDLFPRMIRATPTQEYENKQRRINELQKEQSITLRVEWLRPAEGMGPGKLERGYDSDWDVALIGKVGKGWFSAGYGAVRRLLGQSEDASKYARNRPEVANILNLLREDAALFEPIEWLKSEHHQYVDEKNATVGALLDGCIALLNDGLLPPGIKVLRVDSKGVWARQGDQELSLLQLSAGNRTVAALVLDVIRHLSHAYGDRLRFERADGRVVVPHSGVVLIDEPEQHLHPSWQQRLGFWFKEHFPNMQFLVATHSPFICQAADQGRLIRLNLPGEVPVAQKMDEETTRRVVAGGVDEAAVSALFGLDYPHSEESEKKRERVADLEAKELDDELTQEERLELERLLDELPSTPSAAVEQVLRRLACD